MSLATIALINPLQTVGIANRTIEKYFGPATRECDKFDGELRNRGVGVGRGDTLISLRERSLIAFTCRSL